MIVGSVDEINSDGAAGWLYHDGSLEQMSIVASLRDKIVGETEVSEYRDDLDRVGFGDGNCGFRMKFFERVSAADLFLVSFKPKGSTLSISRTTNAAFVDFVQSALAHYPAAGRNRSLLGGLWTDRTDALQLLAGRTGLGRVDGALDRDLRALVTNGYVAQSAFLKEPLQIGAGLHEQIIAAGPQRSYPDGPVFKADLSRLVDAILQPSLMALLTEIFDEKPVIYGLDIIGATAASFAQLAALEEFSSPAECVAVYLAASGEGGRIDCISGSHLMAEFNQDGQSRWMRQSAEIVRKFAMESRSSVRGQPVGSGTMLLVGPGTIHRPVAAAGSLLQLLVAPARVTPLRFLADQAWVEISHPSGARVRI